jgi:serine/threonine protein kinase
LSYLHSQNPPIIHRDIKPANIRITPQGKAVLVDFGIAKQNSGGKSTTVGAKAISPGYSPPEQYMGSGTDERSDVYALGATLYTLLTGIELPESIGRMMAGQTGTQPPHLARIDVQPQVSLAIMQAIDPSPTRRFASIAEFQSALFDPQPADQAQIPAVPAPNNGKLVWGLGALVVGLLVVILFLLNSNSPSAAAVPANTPMIGGTNTITPLPTVIPPTVVTINPTATKTIGVMSPVPINTITRSPTVIPPTVVTIKPTATNTKTVLQSGLIAYYPLHGDPNEATNRTPPMTLVNAPFTLGGVSCNGVYEFGGGPGFCKITTPQLDAFNYASFSISARFNPAEIKGMPVFMGGASYRWIGFYLLENGHVGLRYNNSQFADCNATYTPGTWYNATITYNGSTAKMYLDNTLVCTQSFALEQGGDKDISVTNFSNTQVFHGILSDLKIYNTVITP